MCPFCTAVLKVDRDIGFAAGILFGFLGLGILLGALSAAHDNGLVAKVTGLPFVLGVFTSKLLVTLTLEESPGGGQRPTGGPG